MASETAYQLKIFQCSLVAKEDNFTIKLNQEKEMLATQIVVAMNYTNDGHPLTALQKLTCYSGAIFYSNANKTGFNNY